MPVLSGIESEVVVTGMKKLLIGIVGVAVVFGGASLYLADSFISPKSPFYFLKSVGEWLDLNFLVFDAPGKQARHLQYAQRRLDEALELKQVGESTPDSLNYRYELELARAEFMAEQLALIDHKFIPALESAYLDTLDQLKRLREASLPGELSGFEKSAQLYNEKSIKILLRKHQYSGADQERYRALVELRLEFAASGKNLSDGELAAIKRSSEVIKGKELEWAYDLVSRID